MTFLLFFIMTLNAFSATKDADGNIVADAATQNDELFEATVNVEPKFSQLESFTVQSNVMYNCVDTSLNGRQDNVCQTNPNAPECVGLRKTLENATNCLEYFVPATLGCKTYGTAEHPAEDWVAFGNNYYNTLSQCTGTKTSSDGTKQRLQSLTEMLMYDPNAPTGPGITLLKDYSQSGWNSGISETKKEEGLFSSLWKDGASLLGYQDGDIIKSAAKKESFFDVVVNSPFVNDLNVVNREKFENGVTNSSMIIERVKAAGKFPTMVAQEGDANNTEPTTASVASANSSISPTDQALGSTVPLAGPGMTIANQSSGFSVEPKLENVAKNTPISSDSNKVDTTVSTFARKPLLAEKIAELEMAAKQKKNIRSLASEEEPKTDTNDSLAFGSEEVTLFQRVRKNYSKRQEGFRSSGAKTTDSILQLEKPQIFQDL